MDTTIAFTWLFLSAALLLWVCAIIAGTTGNVSYVFGSIALIVTVTTTGIARAARDRRRNPHTMDKR